MNNDWTPIDIKGMVKAVSVGMSAMLMAYDLSPRHGRYGGMVARYGSKGEC